MKTLTVDEFKTELRTDPAWASKLTQPVAITEYCSISGSRISHLSPLLHFTGKDEDGNCASFQECDCLKVAEGTFDGWVDFSRSGIEKIGKLIVTPDKQGYAAHFGECKKLKIAEGNFGGYVDFHKSGIEKIGDLHIDKPNTDGGAANFYGCESLKIAEGIFPGRVFFSQSGIERIGKLKISSNGEADIADFSKCDKLTLSKAWLERTDIVIGDDLRERSEIQLRNEAAARKAIKQPTFEL